MPSRLNQLMVQELNKEFTGVDTCVFLDFTGLTGRKAADLRHQLKANCGPNAALSVVKTSLARRVFAQADAASPIAQFLSGPTAVAYGADDPVIMVRFLADWSKKQEVVRFKGGLLAGRPIPPDAVAQLATIPPRAVLLAQAVGTAAAPLSALLTVTQGLLRKMLGVVDALAAKKSQSPGN